MGSLFSGKYSQYGNRFLRIKEAYLEPSPKSSMESPIKNVYSFFEKVWLFLLLLLEKMPCMDGYPRIVVVGLYQTLHEKYMIL